MSTDVERNMTTCAFCEGVTRQQIAVFERIASSVKASLWFLRTISRATPSTTNANSCCKQEIRRNYQKDSAKSLKCIYVKFGLFMSRET